MATQAQMTQLSLRAAGATHIGKRRKHNEDVAVVRDDLLLYVVADGAGGHNAGEVASRLACRSISNFFGATVRATFEKPEFDRFGVPTGERRLSQAVHKANRDIVEISETSERHRGMGTTIVAASFSPRSGLMHVAHVGDSRCYRLRGGHLEQLTIDHSLLTDIIEQRPDLDDQALVRVPKNVVTRALGMSVSLRVSVRSYAVVEGDRYLLCSDGLCTVVEADQIAAVLAAKAPPEQIVHRLITLANDAGGPDNIAAIVAICSGGHALARPARAEIDDSYEDSHSDPELLILGIEELELDEQPHTVSDGLLRAIDQLMTARRDEANREAPPPGDGEDEPE